jgi:hypothetical protein
MKAEGKSKPDTQDTMMCFKLERIVGPRPSKDMARLPPAGRYVTVTVKGGGGGCWVILDRSGVRVCDFERCGSQSTSAERKREREEIRRERGEGEKERRREG